MSKTDPTHKSFKKVDRSAFRHDDLIGIEALSPDEINIILDLADYYADRLDEREFKPDILRGGIVLTLFFEDSTRTRVSFEMAAKRLGADVVNMDIRTSSMSKGESLTDTIQTLVAGIGPDAIVVRHSEYNAPRFIANLVDCPVINAGDSYREHPTQALLDALTIRRHFGKLDGLRVAICGDIAHSRVANSNMILLRKMGVEVNIVAPTYLKPEKFPADGINAFDNMKDGLKDCDVVMMLRNQKERMQSGLIASEEDFFKEYGLTYDKLAFAKPHAVVMHPGPMNRGVEIDGDVADDKQRSLILEQVKNGVPTRMAVMDLLLKEAPVMAMLPYFVGFMAMACYALMGPIAKMTTGTSVGPFTFIALASSVLTIIAAGVAYTLERGDFSQSVTGLKWNWLALYIVVNFVSYAGYIWAIGRIPVAQFEMFGIFVPVIGGFFAWWILKEPFHMRYFLALAFMAVGIMIAIGPELRSK